MVLAAGEALRCVRLRAGWTPQGWVGCLGLGGFPKARKSHTDPQRDESA